MHTPFVSSLLEMDTAEWQSTQDMQDKLGLKVDRVWVGWSQVDTAGLAAAFDRHPGPSLEVSDSVNRANLQIWVTSRDWWGGCRRGWYTHQGAYCCKMYGSGLWLIELFGVVGIELRSPGPLLGMGSSKDSQRGWLGLVIQVGVPHIKGCAGRGTGLPDHLCY